MKQLGRCCRITPIAILKCGHVEMHEHAETQIDKPLLQFQKRQWAARSHARFVLHQSGAAMTQEQRGSRSLRGQLEKLSSCRHLRSLPQAVCVSTNRMTQAPLGKRKTAD